MTRSRETDASNAPDDPNASYSNGFQEVETQESLDAVPHSPSMLTADGTPPPPAPFGRVRKRPDQDPLLGQFINNLQIVSCIGRGGFGAVYMAEHTELQTPFAVKVLNVFQSTRSTVVERFRREARAIAMLSHPHIIQVTDFGWLEGSGYYLVMEYTGRENLRDALGAWDWEREIFPLARTRKIMEQLCFALQWVHEKGIVHRDLKPSNILLSRDEEGQEQLKLIDFGIAALTDEFSLTEAGTTMGSPAYMSPEQARGSRDPIDGRSDLYSLGIVLFHMLTGTLPFQGKGLAAYIRLHVKQPPPRLQERAPKVAWHPALESLVAYALAKAPADRPVDAMAFWALCEEALLAQEQQMGEVSMAPGSPAVRPEATGGLVPMATPDQHYLSSMSDGETLALSSSSLLAPLAEITQLPLEPVPMPAPSSAPPGPLVPLDHVSPVDPPAQKTPPDAEPPHNAPSVRRTPTKSILIGLLFCFLAGGGVAWFVLPGGQATRTPKATNSPRYEIHANPRAAIYVNGKPLGQTPYFGEGIPGQRLVFVLQRPGYRSLSIRWVLGNKPLQKRVFQLQPVQR